MLTPEELELSLILAQASSFTYYEELFFEEIQEKTGISNVEPFNFNYENQWLISGFLGYYQNYAIITFKGTDSSNDWKTNLRFWQNNRDFNGQVHSGFAQALLNNWDELLNFTKSSISQDQTILLTGHSLGGALAILTASKLSSLPEFRNRIEAVYTYGAPRVGDQDFSSQYSLTHYRFEYGNDPVPSSPSINYKHTGRKYYLPKNEPIIEIDSQGFEAYKVHIKLASVASEIVRLFINSSNFRSINNSIQHINGVFEDVSDHNIEKYIQHIQNYKQFRVIIQGLQNGTLKRHGSVIKDNQTGNIVCYLFEQPPNETEESPISRPREISLVQIPLQMSSIATGASVLNLGISLAGFAHMNTKLNQMQTALNELNQSLETRANLIEDRLDILCLRVEDIQQKQDSIIQALSDNNHKLILMNIADLKAAIEMLYLRPDKPRDNILQTVIAKRFFLLTQVEQHQPTLDSQNILFTDFVIKAWVVATATQAYLMLEDGNIDQAQNFLNEEVTKFRNITRSWADQLIAHEYPNIATAYRFTADVFRNRNISQEQVDRIAYISSVDENLTQEEIEEKLLQVEVEFLLTDYEQELNHPEWIEKQIFVARYLDTLSELLARLESLQAFTELCNSQDVESIRNILPVNDAQPGLYLQFLRT
ncbi:MAG: lipase family protein [Xenococcaceae cyanobacterium MO_207.B15]|nr:lipase family protein [Xenococcaceae cyanobacterium MO_207.B15]